MASTHTVRSQRGGASTVLMIIGLLFISWTEFGHFFGGEVDHQFKVEEQVSHVVTLNLDLVVNMPCNFIHTNVRDVTADRFLAGELLQYEGVPFYIPSYYNVDGVNRIETPDLDEILAEGFVAEFRDGSLDNVDRHLGAPACHIFGRIPLNRVKGVFHITAKNYGYTDLRSHVDRESLNFTHSINELSFGEFYPYIDNPLDGTAQVSHVHMQSYNYYLSVVPTVYKKLGVVIDTNQYAMSLLTRDNSHNREVPGLFFDYDFEPIQLVVEDRRISFTSFIVRLATIYGGVIICGQYLYRVLDKLLVLLFGHRYASRGQEKSQGLLDDDAE